MEQVRLGYVRLVYPTLNPCGTEPRNWWSTLCKPGFNVEIWKTIARQAKLRVEMVKAEIYGDEDMSSADWDGMLGMIEAGVLNASVELMPMTPDAIVDFKFSLPVQPEEVGFVTGVPLERSKPPNYFVYQSYWIYLWILLLLGLGLVQAAFRTFRKANNERNWKRVLREYPRQLPGGFWSAIEQSVFSAPTTKNSNPLYVLGFVLIFISYYSGFRGQRYALANVAEIRLADIQRKLMTGATTLIVDHYAVLSDELNRTLYPKTNPNPIILAEYKNITELLCSDSHTIFYGEIFRIFKEEDTSCVLERINVPELSQNLGFKALVFSKSTKARFMEVVNEIILKFYGLDKWDTYWVPRYYPRGDTKPQGGEPDSLKVMDLSPGFFLWAGGATLSIVICLLERLWYAYWKRQLKNFKVSRA
uniref:Uncharacterized protein n=1 Tax=Plectus sambesii TaxID=2011161 RepID=A0A914VHH1_9BILA